jgi:hypothetical protein
MRRRCGSRRLPAETGLQAYAQRLGKAGADAEAYANAVVIADLEEPGDEDLIRRVVSDLQAAGVPAEEDQIRGVLERFMVVAIAGIKAGE